MHRESEDDGPASPPIGRPWVWFRLPDPHPAAHGDAGTAPRPEPGRAKARAARASQRAERAEHEAWLRRTDAFIAETRALLAQIKAGTFRADPAAPPRLRIVGGTDWSGE